MSVNNIRTPHAAVIVWNYKDRIDTPKEHKVDASGTTANQVNNVEETIISTLSCISIQTNKSKGQPDGSFNLVLAPFKNWVSTISPGSWCVILMSNSPITEKDLKQANSQKVKMLGKIETVRVQTEIQQDGSRKTLYYVSGTDWGHIFNSTLYIDNLIAGANEPRNQGNTAAQAIQKTLFDNGGTPKSFLIRDNMRSIIDIFGKTIHGLDQAARSINRLAGVKIHNFNMPKEMADYFQFKRRDKQKIDNPRQVNQVLNLIDGYLSDYDTYTPANEARGFIDPFSLQGTHSFWQVLLENSNPALNEMFCDIRWDNNTPILALYNRIKPFSFKGYSPSAGFSNNLRSYFQNIRQHVIDNDTVISINAGTNWRDKYNFVEIKPNFQDFNVIANWSKQKSQLYDILAFDREGFRPLIVATKQFPVAGEKIAQGSLTVDFDQLEKWCYILREWYFDTHRLLNGTVVMTGINEYIGVGDNIALDAKLMNPTPNMNKTMLAAPDSYLLAHVESIAHSFTVGDDGARRYQTTIQFVRGLIVDENDVTIGDAAVDKYTTDLSPSEDRNRVNAISTSTESDPDEKVRGT